MIVAPANFTRMKLKMSLRVSRTAAGSPLLSLIRHRLDLTDVAKLVFAGQRSLYIVIGSGSEPIPLLEDGVHDRHLVHIDVSKALEMGFADMCLGRLISLTPHLSHTEHGSPLLCDVLVKAVQTEAVSELGFLNADLAYQGILGEKILFGYLLLAPLVGQERFDIDCVEVVGWRFISVRVDVHTFLFEVLTRIPLIVTSWNSVGTRLSRLALIALANCW